MKPENCLLTNDQRGSGSGGEGLIYGRIHEAEEFAPVQEIEDEVHEFRPPDQAEGARTGT